MNRSKRIVFKPGPFAWLNITQFFGALNDNVFQLLVILFLSSLLIDADPDGEASIMAIAGVVFVLPFLLFSHAAGVLADRFSKRNIIVFAKCLEVVVMLGGLVAVILAGASSSIILYVMIFVMCTQSAVFGPSKYGIIPELVPRESLSKANSFLVGLTYLAIIFGTFIPAVMLDKIFPGNFLALAVLCVVISVFGLVACLRITPTPAVGMRRSFTPFFFVDIFKTLFRIRADRYLLLTIIGSAYFLGLAGFIKFNLIQYGQWHLLLSREQSCYLFPVAALGIGLGAILAGKLSGRNIEFGGVPVGAGGLTVTCILFSLLPQAAVFSAGVLSFFLGISCGLFIVPLNAFIQERAPRERLGEILAVQNFLSFLAVALGMGLLKILASVLGFTASMSFLVVGLLTAVLAVCTIIVLPDFLIRFVVVFITRFFYRMKVRGIENLPTSGPALIVANHVTWVDSMLIAATQQRHIRFMMGRDIYDSSWLKPVFKLMKVIPVSDSDGPRSVLKSLALARAALDAGDIVCIFAEGAITRNGNMRAFRPGMERIMKGSNYPIIPVHIGGAWGSIFSHYYGKLFSRFPGTIPYDISVVFGGALPASASSNDVRRSIQEMSHEAFDVKKTRCRSLPCRFIKTARRCWFRQAISDTTGKSLTFGNTLVAAIALSDQIESTIGDRDKVGIIMPASVAGALANLAVSLRGRVPVNLNFTASADSVKFAVQQCGIKTVLSSRAFLKKLGDFTVPDDTVFLEDIMPKIGRAEKIRALLKALFLPANMIMDYGNPGPDDLATVIFSSGSTGQPKGVMLSHHNILSNLESFGNVFRFDSKDRLCGILPFFHSFGFTTGLWAPLVIGFSTVYHPNPIDGSKVAEIVRENKLTALLTTPTFLLAYIRRGKKEDFESLRAVVTGAEKLKKKVADSFEKKFGLRPLEGYGTTELSPVAALNLPDVQERGVKQVGNKDGSIGHPLPGVAMKVVNPDTGDLLPDGEDGLLMVKGPNVMMGYLGNPEKTKEVLQDGWYNTGDIAKMDEDGFAYIVGRFSRYSKIGGEMVPHIAIEDKFLGVLSALSQVVFVTSAPDEKKGEQLVVLYTEEAGDVDELYGIMKDSDLPNLWKPKRDNYFVIDKMPTLGSGKLDLKQLNVMAGDFVEQRQGSV